jgi:formate dehydrogenase major subunit
MTNHWLDLQNAKVFLIEGSNAAENHPMSMRWLTKAKEKGAIVIHVDPRYNRTSKIADIYARIRPGTDIAFLGSIINYILTTKQYDEAYVNLNTNAHYLMSDDFKFEEGIFSGFNEVDHKYDNASWGYQLDPKTHKPLTATSLDDPRCVMSKLKEFYKRYTFKVGSDISGIPEETIKLIADTMIKNRPGTIMYALGMTQHTVGVQNIRCFGVLQLLLGNMGKPGGGVNAMRGEPNVQGSTDMALLFNYLPGYLAYPNHDQQTINDWSHYGGTFRAKFLVNLLKAWFGENATKENDFGYGWLAKKNGKKNYSMFRIFETAVEGKMKMLYVMGQNPMVTASNTTVCYEGLSKLDMLVVADPFMTETACFWEKPGGDPKKIMTEVVYLPAASFLEKEGTKSNSGRLVQWNYTMIKPPGQAKSDLEMVDLLFKKVRDLYASSTEEKDQIFKKVVWNYPKENMYEAVLQEIGGYDLKTGEHITKIVDLQPDGSTSCGAWIYAGVYGGGKNLSKRKDNKTDPSGLGIYPGFAWSWPGNMKVLYNRASCDKDGVPLDKKNPLVWWDAAQKKWAGYDTPDVPVATDGPDTPNGQRPFRMSGEGVGRLIAALYKDPDPKNAELPRDCSAVLADGPIPEFYEPVESPVDNILHPKVAINPCLKYPRMKALQPIGKVKDYPYVLSTSSLAEHWCCGAFTRNVPWLNEIAPETYVEIPEKLGKKLSISTGDKVRVWSARGEVVVPAMVTKRMETLHCNGQEIFVIWMPYNWGFKGLSTAASTNLITIDAGDPNTWTQETKACLVNMAKA